MMETQTPIVEELQPLAVERDSDYLPALRSRRGDPGFILPKPYPVDGVVRLNLPSASSSQREHAAWLWAFGLEPRAVRQSRCNLVGGRRDCLSGREGHSFYIRFRCGNRYCPVCGPFIFRALFAKHVRLAVVVKSLVPHWPVYGHRPERVIGTIDFTLKNTGEMPDAGIVRRFNACIRKFFRLVEKRLGVSRAEYGVLWCDEFGGRDHTNLHAHGIYAGPWLPQAELSDLWREVTRREFGPAMESFRIWIEVARSFEVALAHALKYAGKFLSKDPARLAQLENTFHGTRRVHALAAFYNPKDTELPEGLPEPVTCPLCGDFLIRPQGWSWQPVEELEAAGLRDLDEVRREVGRTAVFSGPGPP